MHSPVTTEVPRRGIVGTVGTMDEVFIGGAERRENNVTAYQLTNHHLRLLPNVYLRAGSTPTAMHRVRAAWRWSRGRGTIAGYSAALLHGSKWIDADQPAELIYTNRHRHPGVVVHSDRLRDGDTMTLQGMTVTTVARTILDLACWYPRDEAVKAIDALLQATKTTPAAALVLAGQSPRRRRIAEARRTLALVDGGAQSPRETWLRLALGRMGFPPLQTQIPVYDEYDEYVYAYLDMGWPQWKIAIEYDGDHHRTNRGQFRTDRRRIARLEHDGWIVIRVTSDDSESTIAGWVNEALAKRRS
ncbi:hypothetical protein MFAL_32000 [Mycolicibacterium fallax]|nr:hypothetical protein MFAL_32000 [Mycolicibacterium fallax]